MQTRPTSAPCGRAENSRICSWGQRYRWGLSHWGWRKVYCISVILHLSVLKYYSDLKAKLRVEAGRNGRTQHLVQMACPLSAICNVSLKRWKKLVPKPNSCVVSIHVSFPGALTNPQSLSKVPSFQLQEELQIHKAEAAQEDCYLAWGYTSYGWQCRWRPTGRLYP